MLATSCFSRLSRLFTSAKCELPVAPRSTRGDLIGRLDQPHAQPAAGGLHVGTAAVAPVEVDRAVGALLVALALEGRPGDGALDVGEVPDPLARHVDVPAVVGVVTHALLRACRIIAGQPRPLAIPVREVRS